MKGCLEKTFKEQCSSQYSPSVFSRHMKIFTHGLNCICLQYTGSQFDLATRFSLYC